MDANSSADSAADYDIYNYLLSRFHEPCFIIFNQPGSPYIINKCFATTLKYRSVKEFYRHNVTIYHVFTEDQLKLPDNKKGRSTIIKHVTIKDKYMQPARFVLHLKYFGNYNRNNLIISGIFVDKENNKLDQALLSFLNNDEFLDEAMFILDFNGNMLTANRKVHQIDFFANLTDKKINFFSLIDESDKDKLKKRLRGLKKGLILPPVEYKLVSPDKRTAYIKLYSRLITYNNKKTFLTLIRDITLRKQTEKRLIQAIIETEENERQRFASDLHDQLGPFFSGIKLYIHELKSLRNEPRKQVRVLNLLLKMTEEVSSRIRTISSNLTPNNMIDLGLAYSVKKMINQINQTGQVTIHLKIKGEEEQMENQYILSLYHIILELINNGIKHSGSHNLNVILWFQSKNIQIVYSDNGRGFELNDELKAKKGIGLKSILNRIIFYQGTYKFVRKNTKGIQIELNFPKSSI